MKAKIKSILFVALYIIIYLVAQTIAVLVPPIVDYFKKYSELNLTTFLYELGMKLESLSIDVGLVVILSALISTLIYIFIIKIRKVDFIKVRKFNPLNIVAAIFITYGLNIVAILVTSLKIFQNLIPEYSSLMDNVMKGNLLFTLFSVGIVAPIFEEFMNRGVILGELRRGFGFATANIIQGLIFGVMHGNIVQGAYAFIIGITLGYVYKKTNSIYMPFIIHIMFNVSNVLLDQFAKDITALPSIAVNLGILSLFIGIKMLDIKSLSDNNMSINS